MNEHIASEYRITIEGHELVALALNREATGDPIILLHGITASANFWHPKIAAPFVEAGPCYSLSLPGHYPATFPPGLDKQELTAEMLARVLTTAIRDLVGERPVTLVGHSTGGFAALAVAAHTPHLPHRVISIAGFGRGEWSGALGMYQRWVRSGSPGTAAFKVTYRLVGMYPYLFRQSLRIYSANPRALYTFISTQPNFSDLVYGDFRKLDMDAMALYFAAMPEIDITSQLANITSPTLVLTGNRDPIVPPAEARRIAAAIPNATLVEIPGAGHAPMIERWAEYYQAVKSWLANDAGRIEA